MIFTKKTIALLQSELRKNPFDLDKIAELYAAYLPTHNAMVLLEIAEARYKILTTRYPAFSDYISAEKYTQKKYFESPNRIELENLFIHSANSMVIRFIDSNRNPENSFSETCELHDEFWREAVAIVLKEESLEAEELDLLKHYVFSAIKTLGRIYQSTKVLNSLEVENYGKKYYELVESMEYLLIAAQKKRKLILLKEIINLRGFPDADIVGLIESDEKLKKLLN